MVNCSAFRCLKNIVSLYAFKVGHEEDMLKGLVTDSTDGARGGC